jgi:DNA-binding HxlR family transcriptional regulator
LSTPDVVFHHRWSIPVLAELHRSSGSRFVTLVGRLGVSRESLRQTLGALIEHELVKRNPGYGHPLRPEYILTHRGRPLGDRAAALFEALEELDALDVGLKKWSLPTLAALAAGELRFSSLRAALPGVTARSLTLALKDLADAGLVRRRVTDDYPPSTVYRLTPRARPLVAALGVTAETPPLPGARPRS